VENDGNAHSVAFINSNAQGNYITEENLNWKSGITYKIYCFFVPEFVISPAPGYTYRTIGGLLDIYLFLGPTPEDTVRQFTEAIGRQPIPPYWGLGFQLSRWGYNTIDKMQAAVNRTKTASIPQVCAIIH